MVYILYYLFIYTSLSVKLNENSFENWQKLLKIEIFPQKKT